MTRAIRDSPAIYLVRHAHDAAAAAARFGDEGLSPQGAEQARRLARALSGLNLRGALVSPLLRARQTADLLLDGRDLPVHTEPLLAEGSHGDLAGLGYEEAALRFKRDFQRGRTVVARLAASGRTAPGGESREEFLTRVRAASRLMRAELEKHAPALLVISHGGLLNYLLQDLLQLPIRDEVPFGFDHCGVVRLVSWREGKGFGPFPMLRFGLP